MWWRVLVWMSLGIPFLWVALLVQHGKGRMNRWYLHGFSSMAYGFLVWGLTIFFQPLALLLPVNADMKIYFFGGVTAVGVILTFIVFPFWKPDFLKPTWLRHLESQYPPDAVELFKHEWKKMNRDEWAGKIGTEEGMNELMKQVTDKYGEYDPKRKMFVKTVVTVELSRPD